MKSSTQIEKDFISKVDDIDSSIEVSYGPLNQSFIKPMSEILSEQTSEVDTIVQLYSTEFIKTASADQLKAFLKNYSLPESTGVKSKGYAYFLTYTRPSLGESFIIPRGVLVCTIDKKFVYMTTEEVTFNGSNASAYYNTANGWYEVKVPIEAINSGSDYDMPINRVRVIMTPVQGFSAVYNPYRITGGNSGATNEEMFARIEEAFFGQDKSSFGGLESLISNYDSNKVKAVSVVLASDRKLFTRFTNQLAADVYVAANSSAIDSVVNEDHIITSATNIINPTKQPIVSIGAVYLNGELVTATLVKDSTSLKGSVRSSDYIQLDSVYAKESDVVTINYDYNKLLNDIDSDVLTQASKKLFNVDLLAYQMLEYKITAQASLVVSSTSSFDAIKSDVMEKMTEVIETYKTGGVYHPDTIRQSIISSISGLTDLTWIKFCATDYSTLAIETVILPSNAIAILDVDNSSLR